MSQALRKLTGVVSRTNTCLDLHQSGARKDRRDVRQSGNDHRRARAEILRVGARRKCAGSRPSKMARRAIGNRTRVKVVKNKVAGAVSGSRVRHPLRRGHLARRGHAGSRRDEQHCGEERIVVQLSRRAHRTGTRHRTPLPERASDVSQRIDAELRQKLGLTAGSMREADSEPLLEAVGR